MRREFKYPFDRSDKPRPLVRTCAEMAKEFGISTGKLSAMMREDENSPKVVLDNRSHCRGPGSKRWYDQNEMRKWYKNKLEKRAA